MGLLDDVLASALPGGKISKPLMLALLALLASGALFGGGDREAAPTQPDRAAPAGGRGWRSARRPRRPARSFPANWAG